MGGEPDQVRWRGIRPVEGISGIWPARNATRIYVDASRDTLGLTVVYTVPATKKMYLSNLCFASRLTAAANVSTQCYLVNASAGTICRPVYHYYTLQDQMVTQQLFFPALELAVGFQIRIYNEAANILAHAMAQGWLEDA